METPEGQNTILIAADDPDQLKFFSTLLRHASFHLLTADAGREGFRTARLERPDLVITNVTKAEDSDVDLCKMIRADDFLRATPILLFSALGNNTEILQALRAGADDYIEMPCEPSLLLTKVVRLLERRRAEEDLERRIAERTEQLSVANQQLEDDIAES